MFPSSEGYKDLPHIEQVDAIIDGYGNLYNKMMHTSFLNEAEPINNIRQKIINRTDLTPEEIKFIEEEGIKVQGLKLKYNITE